MRIGFDVAQTCGERAGCAWYADSLARALAEAAPEHRYLLYHQFADCITPSPDTGTHIVAPHVAAPFLAMPTEEARRVWQSPEALAEHHGGPDIVHANSFRAPRVPGARLVFTVYDVAFWAVPHFTTEANRLVCQAGLLEALGNADGFVFISESSRDEFERMLPGWLDESGRPWQVTPLAARPGFCPAHDLASDADRQPYWLAVGSLEPRKNYETLLDALEAYWARSPAPRPLWIAGGDGWKSDHTARRIEEMASRGMVQRLGYVPDADLCGLYASATALIFPSWYEGCGLPVLEAMSCGCAVIASAVTSLREVGGEAPLYASPGHPESIAGAMLRLESSPEERRGRRAAALQQAGRFSWARTARLTIQLYEQLLRPGLGSATI